jgi:uncharacterized protein (DUF3084 family)
MEIEERMSKAEAEIAALKEGQKALQASVERVISDMHAFQVAVERGFVEQRAAMEHGFAEERAARERAFRWSFSITLSILALVLGIIAKLAGAF